MTPRSHPAAAKPALALLVVCAFFAMAAPALASVEPVGEGVCLGGWRWVALGRSGCPAFAPSAGDLGQPVAALSARDEHNLYVVEQSHPYFSGGGEYHEGADAVVQLHTDAKAVPEFVSCTSSQATADCTQTSNAAAISDAQSAAIAPDGKDVYVASFSGIARFAISAGGTPVYAECIGLEGGACQAPAGRPGSLETVQITLSPDGRDLYSVTDGLLRDFHVAADGTLGLAGCYSARNGCSSGAPFAYETYGTASVSPDGQTVVTALGQARVDAYRRLADGSLLFESCIGAGDTGGGCTPVGAAWMAFTGLQSIVFAPNGRDVYVQGVGPAGTPQPAIFHLRLSGEGTLQLADCLGYVLLGCRQMPAQAPEFTNIERIARRLTIAPDGRKLVLGGQEVDVFSLDPASGAVAYEACAGASAFSCSPDLQQKIDYPGGSVTMTPSGESFWLADATAGTATRFDLADTSSPSPTKAPVAGAVTTHSSDDANILEFSATAQTYGATKLAFEIETASGEVTSISTRESRSEAESRKVEAYAGVTPATNYRVRLTAVNQVGTSHGSWLQVKTPSCTPEPPTLREFRGLRSAPTTLSALGQLSPSCAATSVTMRVGTTPAYGTSFTTPVPVLGGYYVPDFAVQATGLQPGADYYWQLVAANSAGSVVIESGQVTTPQQAPASQLSALTASERPVEDGSVALEGLVRAGSTPVSVEALLFDSPYESLSEPAETISLGQTPAGSGVATVSTTVSGLQCAHAYLWSLRASAAYAESVGERKPFTVHCSSEGAGGEEGHSEGTGGGSEATPPGEPAGGTTVPGGTTEGNGTGSGAGTGNISASVEGGTGEASVLLTPQPPFMPVTDVLAAGPTERPVPAGARIERVLKRRLRSGVVRLAVEVEGKASHAITLGLAWEPPGDDPHGDLTIARKSLSSTPGERTVTFEIDRASLLRARRQRRLALRLVLLEGSRRETKTVALSKG